MRLRVCAAMLLVLNASGLALDEWSSFRPETVKSFSCQVELMQINYNGGTVREDAWSAKAMALRTDGEWAMAIGQFPATLKGRHEAEKVCSKWMDEASKRVTKAVHPAEGVYMDAPMPTTGGGASSR